MVDNDKYILMICRIERFGNFVRLKNDEVETKEKKVEATSLASSEQNDRFLKTLLFSYGKTIGW